MLKRTEHSRYDSQMTSPSLLKQAFPFFYHYSEVQLLACERIAKTATNVQNLIDRLCSGHCVHHYKVELMVQAVHIRNLSVFSFLQ